MNTPLPDVDTQRMALLRAELLRRISHALPHDGRIEPLSGLHLYRVSAPYTGRHGVFVPAFCLIAQGVKQVSIGTHTHRYDPQHYLLTTVTVPGTGQVLEASPDEPYLSLRIALDPMLVSSVLIEAGHAMPRSRSNVSSVDVSPVDPALLDAVVRLVRLIETPAEVPVLQPLITREIVYRLLVGAQGERLRHAAVLGGHQHRIAQAVSRLRDDFDQTIRMEQLAGELGMSLSSFHHQFKAITGMSPISFQKQVRLQEARRLLLAEDLDAATAGRRVGYDNASHFNREYKRLFGKPPMQDAKDQRATA
ncbi:MAG: AraC family transcriptional regulator [Rhodothermales bacterium]